MNTYTRFIAIIGYISIKIKNSQNSTKKKQMGGENVALGEMSRVLKTVGQTS